MAPALSAHRVNLSPSVLIPALSVATTYRSLQVHRAHPGVITIKCRAAGRCRHSEVDTWQQRWLRSCCATLLSLLIVLEAPDAAIPQTLPEPSSALHPTPYEAEVSKRGKRRPTSNLPSPDVAERMLHFDKEAFTEDGWEGMKG